MTFHVPNDKRVSKGLFGTSAADGNNGLFLIFVMNKKAATLRVIASDGEGWEHVSVSLPSRCPTWEEMCKVKEMFWDADDTVMQLHPPKSDWVNNHSYCLHLWRPVAQEIPRPPAIMVGIKGAGVLA